MIIFIYFANGFQTSYSSGNSAKIQLKIYKELGLIKEPFYKRLITLFNEKLNDGDLPNNKFKIVEFQDSTSRAKCAFVGIDNNTLFIPHYSFVVIEPDIIANKKP